MTGDDEDDDQDEDDGEWFSPRTEAGAVPKLPPPSISREPKTMPNPIVGDMAAAFIEGKAVGFEKGVRKTLKALEAEYVERFGDAVAAHGIAQRIWQRMFKKK